MTVNKLLSLLNSNKLGCWKYYIEPIMEDDSTSDDGGCMQSDVYLYTTNDTRRGSDSSTACTEVKGFVDPKLHYDREESVEDSLCPSMGPPFLAPFLGTETETSFQEGSFPVGDDSQTPGPAGVWDNRGGSLFTMQHSVDTEQTLTHSDPYGNFTGRGFTLPRNNHSSLEHTLVLSDPTSGLFPLPGLGHTMHMLPRGCVGQPIVMSGPETALAGDISKLSLNKEQGSGSSHSGVSIDLSKLTLVPRTLTTDGSFDNATITEDINPVMPQPNWIAEPDPRENFYVGRNPGDTVMKLSNCNRQQPNSPFTNVASAIETSNFVDYNHPEFTPEMTSQQDYDGDTMLHSAIIQELMSLVMAILYKIPCYTVLNIANNLKQTPLHLAVLMQKPAVVRTLISRGAHVDVRDAQGNTPLHLACKRGDLAVAKELTRPLQYSDLVKCSYHIPFQRLPQDPTILNYDGQSCVHLAADSENVPLLDYLLKKDIGHDVNIKHGCTGRTILHDAVSRRNMNLVTYLLKNSSVLGLCVNCKTFDGTTPLQLADDNQHMVNMLREAGAVGYEDMV